MVSGEITHLFVFFSGENVSDNNSEKISHIAEARNGYNDSECTTEWTDIHPSHTVVTTINQEI